MSTTEPDLDSRIGTRIRVLRAGMGLTLDGLAQQAEVSRAMLSRIERGESSPTAQLLNRICNGLGVTLSALFAGTEAPANPLSRLADQPVWRDPGTGYQRRQVSPPNTGSSTDITEVEFPAGASVAFHTPRLGGSDQHVWVLDGTLELEIGEEAFRLQAGDCLMMRFDQPIRFRNSSARPVRYAVIICQGATRA
ncbi:MAG TPA: helix-turn-helix domain-containing protein [Roseomonas sp.]|jgi:transcriptional regulator with XRE-family HTH domain